MREISPAIGMSVDEWVANLRPEFRLAVENLRRQKETGSRPRPSSTLIDNSTIMTKELRSWLLDLVAALVDENYIGRAEMCLQFAALVDKALSHLKFSSRPVVGLAIYYDAKGSEMFRWQHAWVRVGTEIIDGNVDCLAENPLVPKTISIKPYWGPVTTIPRDRRLREDRTIVMSPDMDVENIWWPELRESINREYAL